MFNVVLNIAVGHNMSDFNKSAGKIAGMRSSFLYVDTTGSCISHEGMEDISQRLNRFYSAPDEDIRPVDNDISTIDNGPIDDDKIFKMMVCHHDNIPSDDVIKKFRQMAPGGDDLNVSTVFQQVYYQSEKYLSEIGAESPAAE